MSDLRIRIRRVTCVLVTAILLIAAGTARSDQAPGGATQSRGSDSASRAKKTDAQFTATINQIVDSAYAKNHLPSITVVIASRGAPFYQHSDGYLDLAKKITATPNSAYHIGSVSKQFTAVAILLLAKAKPPKLSIDDPISKYFPGLDHRITIRQMMTMTSGLKDYLSLPQTERWARSGVTPAEVAATIAPMPLNFTPGAVFQYSNTNYMLLAGVVEKVSGLKFGDFLRKRLLAPAHLQTIYEDRVPGIPNAAGYAGKDNKPAPELAPSLLLGAGGISASMVDLVQWNRLLLGGRILPPQTVTIM
ncbi:MAG: serine hydrolase domain-containing protein, partial [Candidatus Binataceae bacterium]